MSGGASDDLALLTDFNEHVILDQLANRYHADLIYTYIGDILIAVNPYKSLDIYSPEIGEDYTDVKVRSKLLPHIFAIADKAFQAISRTGVDQCCVVSGESGAGKTESTKLLIEHIVRLSNDDPSSQFHDLHERIVKVNPLLEAFGNAVTAMNDNSSRFGKYVELFFTKGGIIVGAKISEYLLEKSRVISHGYDERNFHVFYYMFAGLSKAHLHSYMLDRPEAHRLLKSPDGRPAFLSERDFMYHRDMMDRLINIMAVVGFTRDETNMIFALLACVLHIGDISFEYDNDTDGVYIVNEHVLDIVSELLDVRPESLATVMICNINILRGERIVTLKNVHQAKDGRDALAKALYARLFGWIVHTINKMLFPSMRFRDGCVGILDIAGFENFQHNSFEQMCINVTNEQLQFFFNQHIFAWEMEEYNREGIKGTHVGFENNRPLLDMFLDKPVGLFSLLDEESKFPRATDASLLEKLKKQLVKNQCFIKGKGKDPVFAIKHYAGHVVYDCRRFLEKNRDTLSVNIVDCMKDSDSQIVSDLFTAKVGDTGTLELNPNAPSRSKKSILQCKDPNRRTESLSRKTGKKMKERAKNQAAADALASQSLTAGSQFRNSLTDLMDKLLSAQPQFIRCIKPNNVKRPQTFVPDIVLLQLRYTGVLETIRIRRLGYPTRLPFYEFIRRYKYIAFPLTAHLDAVPLNCFKIISKAKLHEWEVGKNKVFLKYYHTEQLDNLLGRMEKQVTTVQRYVRGYFARKYFRHLWQTSYRQREMVKGFSMWISDVSDSLCHAQHSQRRADSEREDERKKQELEMKHWQEIQRRTRSDDYNRMRNEQYIREQQQQWRHEGHVKRNISEEVTMMPNQRRTPVSQVIDERYQYNSLQSIKSEVSEYSHYARQSVVQVVRPPVDKMTFYQALIDESLAEQRKLPPEYWCRVAYIESYTVVATFNIRSPEFIIDGSITPFDGYVIGLNSLQNALRDEKTKRIMEHIGKGVLLRHDPEGNIQATRIGKNDIIVKGYRDPAKNSVSAEVVLQMGYLKQDVPTKIFDMTEFKSHVTLEVSSSESPDLSVLQPQCVTSFSFLRDSDDDLMTPCWACVVNFKALNMLSDERAIHRVKVALAKAKFQEDSGASKNRVWSKLNQRKTFDTESVSVRKNRIKARGQGQKVKDIGSTYEALHYGSAPNNLNAEPSRMQVGQGHSKKGWIRVMSPLK